MLTPLVEAPVELSLAEWFSIGLACCSALIQAALVYLFINRKLQTSFPWFFSYNAYGVVAVVLGLTAFFGCRIFHTHGTYGYAFWALNLGFMVIEFGIMYEVVAHILKPYAALIDLGKMLFRWAGLFLLLAAILTASATGGHLWTKCMAAGSFVDRGMRLMQCGLLLLFFLLERRLSLSWRSRNMAIALGLGVSAASGLIVSYVRMQFPQYWAFLGLFDNVSYLAIVGFWGVCFALPEPEKKNVLDSPSRLIFQRWNEALTTYSVRGELAFNGVESFLPGVEQTVDRVLARKMVQ